MSRKKLILVVLCFLIVAILAPLSYHDDHKTPVTTETILFKREAVSSQGEIKYYFILNKTGSLLVTPQAYYSHEIKQTFTYVNGPTKSEIIAQTYGILFFLIIVSLLLLCMFAIIFNL